MNKKMLVSLLLSLPTVGYSADPFSASAGDTDFTRRRKPVTPVQDAARVTVDMALQNTAKVVEEVILQVKSVPHKNYTEHPYTMTVHIGTTPYSITVCKQLGVTESNNVWLTLQKIVGSGFSGEVLRADFFEQLNTLQESYPDALALTCCIRDIKDILATNTRESRRIVGSPSNAENIKTLVKSYRQAFGWNFSYAPATTLHQQSAV